MLGSAITQRRLVTFVPPLVVALLGLPFVLRQNAWWEWGSAYWLLERQTAHVSAHGLPTLFLHTDAGLFNPVYVFYGGPLFTLLAYPAAIVGPWTVFATVSVTALVAGYLGIWWTARSLGLSRTLAILPALTFITTPYILSDLYGRSAWAEFIAINAVAVLVGGLTSLLFRPTRRQSGALAAVVLATATIAGSHNLTTFMCALVLPFVLLALWVLAPRPAASRRAAVAPLARGAGAIALGLGLTAIWLLPNLVYGRDTFAASSRVSDLQLSQSGHLLDLTNLLSIWPHTPPHASSKWLFVQLPALAAVWTLIALAPIVLRPRRTSRRTLTALAMLVTLGTGLFVLIATGSWWRHFPSTFKTIQFPYRLVPYFTIVVCVGMMVAILSLGRARGARLLLGAVAAVVGLQLAGAVWSSWSNEPNGVYGAGATVDDLRASKRPASFTSLSEAQFRSYKHGEAVTLPSAQSRIAHQTTSDDGELRGTAHAGDLQVTRLVWSRMVRVQGDAHLAGYDDTGQAYVAVTRTDPRGQWRAHIGGAHPWPIVVGQIVSLLSAAFLLTLALRLVHRRRNDRVADGAVLILADTSVREPVTG